MIDSDDTLCPYCARQQHPVPGDLREKLIRALKHPIGETRRRASFVLGEKRMSEAATNLIDLVEHDPDLYVAAEAVTALEKIGTPDALYGIERAASHESFVVRERAVEALVAAGGEWADAASEIAENDPSPSVREAAQSNPAKKDPLARHL
ncbi:MAG: HEAT repeat domain-containing protein [Candidatus Binataceae bacterium]|nr:HEAT repeat domain-containing protein [Candidatus Binataceae bacterium]